MKLNKEFLIAFVVTLLITWGLGILRFNHEWASLLFKILLFPFGLTYFLYEKYCTSNFDSSHFFNNEYLQLILFISAVFAQTFFYLFIYRIINRKFKSSVSA